MTHCIEIIGTRRKIYVIKQVSGNKAIPVNGIRYRTEAAAREAAAQLGITISKVGNYYSII